MRAAPLFALPLMLLAGASATGQSAPVVAVQLSSFKFTPSTIVLDHGRPYVLRLANVSKDGHDFTASEFFAAAAVAPADRRLVQEGEVEVPSGQVREIHLTAPAAGSYKIKCSHSFHKMFGMSGKIIVR
jgi:uncharacterized cupredoxin-like copper-binding protein